MGSLHRHRCILEFITPGANSRRVRHLAVPGPKDIVLPKFLTWIVAFFGHSVTCLRLVLTLTWPSVLSLPRICAVLASPFALSLPCVLSSLVLSSPQLALSSPDAWGALAWAWRCPFLVRCPRLTLCPPRLAWMPHPDCEVGRSEAGRVPVGPGSARETAIILAYAVRTDRCFHRQE